MVETINCDYTYFSIDGVMVFITPDAMNYKDTNEIVKINGREWEAIEHFRLVSRLSGGKNCSEFLKGNRTTPSVAFVHVVESAEDCEKAVIHAIKRLESLGNWTINKEGSKYLLVPDLDIDWDKLGNCSNKVNLFRYKEE